MQSAKPVESVLDDIIKAEFQNQPMVESVSVVSKSGLIITGEPSKLPSKAGDVLSDGVRHLHLGRVLPF